MMGDYDEAQGRGPNVDDEDNDLGRCAASSQNDETSVREDSELAAPFGG